MRLARRSRGGRLADRDAAELATIHPALAAADLAVLGVSGSLAAKATPGSTNPSRVTDQLTVLSVAAANARAWAATFRPVLDLGTG